MADLCRRNPRALRRLLQRHVGETGVVVHGWFKRLIYWPSASGWEAVTVKVDGQVRATLDEVHRKPVWIPLEPGKYVLQFEGLDGTLRTERIELGEHPLLVGFKPPTWLPFKSPPPGRWCVRPLV